MRTEEKVQIGKKMKEKEKKKKENYTSACKL